MFVYASTMRPVISERASACLSAATPTRGTKYPSAQLTGRVLDGNGLPIPYANATVHNASDNTLHSGTLTDKSGSFLLELSEEGAYILQISLLSFQSWNSEVFIVSSKPFEKDFPSIVLKEEITQLEGVAVTGQRKLIQRTQEGSVINVQESILTQGSSALQVLERAPGVILDRRNNSFSLNGRSGTLVMINGKAQRIPIADLMALLNGMSADNIQKIELLTNPSSKYDADGNAGIINIVLNKNEALGLRGSIGLSGGYGEGPKQTSNFSLNYGGNHSSLFGTYTFSYDDSSSGWRGVGVTDLPVLGGNTNIVFTSNSQQINRNHNTSSGGREKASYTQRHISRGNFNLHARTERSTTMRVINKSPAAFKHFHIDRTVSLHKQQEAHII